MNHSVRREKHDLYQQPGRDGMATRDGRSRGSRFGMLWTHDKRIGRDSSSVLPCSQGGQHQLRAQPRCEHKAVLLCTGFSGSLTLTRR